MGNPWKVDDGTASVDQLQEGILLRNGRRRDNAAVLRQGGYMRLRIA
jgi:hypothetical protein